MILTIKRYYDIDQTIGEASLKRLSEEFPILRFYTLELPWLQNQRNISCIPEGRYIIDTYSSERYPEAFKVRTPGAREVTDRSAILIHTGNYNKDTKGCILPGLYLSDINADGLFDVTESGKALDLLKSFAGEEFLLDISS